MAEIRNRKFPDTSQEPQRYTKLLGRNLLSMCATCPANFILFYLITVRTCGEEFQTMNYY